MSPRAGFTIARAGLATSGVSPRVKRFERGRERAAVGSQPVSDGILGPDARTLDEAVFLEVAKPLRQHLVRETRDRTTKFAVAHRALLQSSQDHRLPLAADHFERELDGATVQPSQGEPPQVSAPAERIGAGRD